MKQTVSAMVVTLVMLAVSGASADPKVLILGVDGCRPDALELAETPNLDALAAAGAAGFAAQNTMTQGSSGPNWSSAVTGVNVPKHRVTSNSYNSGGFVGNRFDQWPHMFSYLDPSLYFASYMGWGPINEGTHTDDYADQWGAHGETGNTDRVVDLLDGGDPDVIFIQLSSPDSAGHSHGFSPDESGYLAGIEQADGNVGRMLEALYARPGYVDGTEDWLIITTTDHGGHGNEHVLPSGGREVWHTFFMTTGASVVAGADLGTPRIFDVATTTLYHMGVDPMALGLDGRVLGIPGPHLPPPDYNDGLLVHLPLDVSAGDTSGNSLHGTIAGQPQFVDGKFAQSIELANAAAPHQFVSLGTPAELDFGADRDFSLSLWVKTDDDLDNHPAIVSNKDQTAGTNSGWSLFAEDDGLWRWNAGDGSKRDDYGRETYHHPTGTINDGQWHLLVVTHDRDGNAEFYFDGEHANSVNMWDIGDVDSGLPTVLGADGTFGSAWESWFDGQLDDLAIWNRTLSHREVGFIWNDGTGASISSLRTMLISAADSDWNHAATWNDGTQAPGADYRTWVDGHTVALEANGQALSLRILAGGAVVLRPGRTLTVGEALRLEAGKLEIAAAATANVGGNLAIDAAADLEIALAGSDPGQLAAAGDASLAGDLDFQLSGSSPFLAGVYTLISYDSHTGTFDSVADLNAYATGDGLTYGVHELLLTIDHDLLVGDLDLDGDVDFFDYVTTSNNFGESEGMGFQDGDMDGDGDVDFFDYINVSNHFGDTLAAATSVAGATAVPEPSGLVLLGSVLLALGIFGIIARSRVHGVSDGKHSSGCRLNNSRDASVRFDMTKLHHLSMGTGED